MAILDLVDYSIWDFPEGDVGGRRDLGPGLGLGGLLPLLFRDRVVNGAEACGDDCNPELVLQGVVEGGAHHEQRVRVGYLLNHLGGLLHLLQPHVHGPGDVDNDTLGPLDGCLQQGAVDGDAGGLLRLVLACGPAYAHVGQPRVLHHGGDIGEIQVDEPCGLDEVGDGLHRLAQHIVGDCKGIGESDLLVGGILQAVIGDDDQGIYLLPELLNALSGLLHAATALEIKGLGDHAHGQDTLLLGAYRAGKAEQAD